MGRRAARRGPRASLSIRLRSNGLDGMRSPYAEGVSSVSPGQSECGRKHERRPGIEGAVGLNPERVLSQFPRYSLSEYGTLSGFFPRQRPWNLGWSFASLRLPQADGRNSFGVNGDGNLPNAVVRHRYRRQWPQGSRRSPWRPSRGRNSCLVRWASCLPHWCTETTSRQRPLCPAGCRPLGPYSSGL